MFFTSPSSSPGTEPGTPISMTAAAAHVRGLIDPGVPWREFLTPLVSARERIAVPGSVCSILILDGDGLLRKGATPNLPAD
jgi:hypothetical protein